MPGQVAQWQYVAVRRAVDDGEWVVRGPGSLQLPPDEDPLVLLNVAGAQGWELVDRQVLKEFRGGPSMEFLFKRRSVARPAEAPVDAGAADAPAATEPEVAPFDVAD